MAQPRVASRYAKSLLELAESRQELDRVEADLDLLARVLHGSSDLAALLASPVIKPDQKNRVLEAVFGQHLGTLVAGFLRLMVEKGREPYLAEILKSCQELLRKKKNILAAEVRSAAPLSADSRAALLQSIARVHNGPVELKETLSADSIGGYVLRLEDGMMDGSIKRQLEAVRRELVEHDYEPGF